MAKSSRSSDKTTVTRIKASDSSSVKKSKTPAKAAEPRKTTKLSELNETNDTKKASRSPHRAIASYFKGSWHELRQVRWPDRRTTWSMTGALLAFTGFFVVVILLLDAGFQELFNTLIGS